MYYQLFIINRSGGLIYSRSLSLQSPKLSTNDCLILGSTTNDCLILGSTFHGLHSIAQQIAPVISAGIERLETDTFILQCLQTLTGTKFVITASPGTAELELLLQGIYEVYTDYVLKNPFYEVDMPIRCELFNQNLEKLIQKNVVPGGKKRGN
eukprot:gene2450-2605_t